MHTVDTGWAETSEQTVNMVPLNVQLAYYNIGCNASVMWLASVGLTQARPNKQIPAPLSGTWELKL